MENTSSLPPIKELFRESWNTFTASVLKLFIFGVLMICISAAFGILAVGLSLLLAFATGIVSLFSQMGIAAITSIPLPTVLVFVALLAAIFICWIIISSVGNIVPIRIVANYPAPVSLKNEIRKSLSLVLPLLVTQLLVFVVTLGSAFLFILPAILFSFFFMFVNYEVILANQKLTGAIKRSVFIVNRHFGEILVRILLYFLVYIMVVVFVPNVITRIGPKTGIFISIFSVLVNALVGWFGLCFGVTLYKQAKVGLEKGKGGNILWVWIISVLGWAVFSILVFTGIKLLSSEATKIFDNNSTLKFPPGNEL